MPCNWDSYWEKPREQSHAWTSVSSQSMMFRSGASIAAVDQERLPVSTAVTHARDVSPPLPRLGQAMMLIFLQAVRNTIALFFSWPICGSRRGTAVDTQASPASHINVNSLVSKLSHFDAVCSMNQLRFIPESETGRNYSSQTSAQRSSSLRGGAGRQTGLGMPVEPAVTGLCRRRRVTLPQYGRQC